MGKQTFLKSQQMATPQIFGLIPPSQIRKFMRCASLQIANPQISTKNTTYFCRKTVIKGGFVNFM
jgi:hypothetical protein